MVLHDAERRQSRCCFSSLGLGHIGLPLFLKIYFTEYNFYNKNDVFERIFAILVY